MRIEGCVCMCAVVCGCCVYVCLCSCEFVCESGGAGNNRAFDDVCVPVYIHVYECVLVSLCVFGVSLCV